MDESPDRGRRQYLSGLAAGAAAATAGCLSWDQTGATDLILYSLAAETTAVSVVITSDGATEPHTSRTLEVAQGENVDPVNDGKLPTNTGYTVEVAVEGGTTETFEWSDPDLEFAPLYVVVESPQSVEFLFHAG